MTALEMSSIWGLFQVTLLSAFGIAISLLAARRYLTRTQ